MDSQTAPSGGSASDNWTIQGRMRGKARGSTRAGALADSAHQHGSAWPAPAAAEQCSVLNGQGLPPRAGSEYEDDLRAYGADRYVPTDAERYASNKGGRLCTQAENEFTTLAEQLATLKAEMRADRFEQLGDLKAEMLGDLKAEMRAMFELIASRLPATPAPPPATPTATPSPQQQFLEEQELWLAEDHIAFGAASRIQDDEDEARENELLRVRAMHFLVAQERPCAQDKDNAQYLEQENDEGTGVREMDTTPTAVKIFAVVHQDRYISTAADAPRQAARSTSRSRARSRPTRARTPSASRTSTSQSTPAPWSRLAPSHASGLTTKSTLEYCSRRPSALLFYTQGRLKG